VTALFLLALVAFFAASQTRAEEARSSPATPAAGTAKTLEEYFIKFSREIMRPARGFLRHPYLVPGGTYQDQLWDWDSYWLTKGLLHYSATDSKELLLVHASMQRAAG